MVWDFIAFMTVFVLLGLAAAQGVGVLFDMVEEFKTERAAAKANKEAAEADRKASATVIKIAEHYNKGETK